MRKSMLKNMQLLKQSIDKALASFLVFIFFLLVICVIWQVLARWFGISSLFTDEAARYMFIWVGLFGAAYAHGLHRHLAVDLLITALKGKTRQSLQFVLHGLVIAFASTVMVYGGGKLLLNTFTNGQITPTLQIPMWIIYLSLPASGALITFYSLYDLLLLALNADAPLDDQENQEGQEDLAEKNHNLEICIHQGEQ